MKKHKVSEDYFIHRKIIFEKLNVSFIFFILFLTIYLLLDIFSHQF